MRFSDFVQLMHRYIGCSVKQQEYVLYLTNLVIRDPMTDDEKQLDEDDAFNPLSGKDVSTLSKIYSGAQNRKIKQEDARTIQSLFSKTKFVDAFQTVDYEAREELIGNLNGLGIQGNLEADNIDEVCAELFYRFIDAMASNKGYIDTSIPVHIDSCGNRYVTVEVNTVYVKDGKLHVGDEVLELPAALAPEKDIKPEEMPYVNALCAAYADALTQAVTPDIIGTLPGRYRRDFSSQRTSYYEAEWLHHSVRDVFDGGEEKFEALKKDAYDGIESTYLKDYDNGYQRLQAVLDKITNTTLDTSSIDRIKSLMKNVHKKGICHILVNDGTIKSWVDIDE